MKETNYSIWNNFLWSKKTFDQLEGKKYHWIFLGWILLTVGAPFLGICFPAFAIQELTSKDEIWIMVVSVILFALGLRLITTLQTVLDNEQIMSMFMGRIDTAKLYEKHLLSIDYEKYESSEGQEKMEAARKAVYRGNEWGIEAFMLQFPTVVMNFIGILVYSVIVFRIHWLVLVYMLVTSFILAKINVKIETYDNLHMDDYIQNLTKRSVIRADVINGEYAKDIRLYHAKSWILKCLEELVQTMSKYWNGKFLIALKEQSLSVIFGLIRDLAVYILLIYQIGKGKLGIADLLLSVGVIAGFSVWMSGFLLGIQRMHLNNGTITDLRNFLAYGDVKEEDKDKEDVKQPGGAHELRLENVGYTYFGNEKATIRNVNLVIHPGEKLALVGMNGAGKSTLIKIICGLYQPTEGKIYLDGQDASTIAREAYFREFSVVFQDVFAFACSIADNVSCQLPHLANRKKIENCIDLAGLRSRVEKMEQQIDTPVTTYLDENGVELSGGQMQKLMLARALYKDAPVLVLDEPTAALDPLAESQMYEAYLEFAKDKTSIFISHRLSSTQFCDRICYMEDGEICEIGSHEELIQLQKGYARMFQTQAQYYQDDWDGMTEQEGMVEAYEG